eukprot:5620295-Pyramimonas_sp.AAC.1
MVLCRAVPLHLRGSSHVLQIVVFSCALITRARCELDADLAWIQRGFDESGMDSARILTRLRARRDRQGPPNMQHKSSIRAGIGRG